MIRVRIAVWLSVLSGRIDDMTSRRLPMEYADPVERKQRERRAAASVRAQRVERLQLVPCLTCGGTEDRTTATDPTLWCECEGIGARLAARTMLLAHENRDPDVAAADRSDRIAP